MNGIKSIKYLNWEKIFEKKIHDIRQKEFSAVQGVEYADTVINFLRRTTTVVMLFVLLNNITELNVINIYTVNLKYNF